MPGSPSYDALKVKVLVVQSCLTFCDLMDYSLPGSSVHRILQARILDCHFLLQGIFLTQGTNSCLCLLRWQAGSLPPVPPEKPTLFYTTKLFLQRQQLSSLLWSFNESGPSGSALHPIYLLQLSSSVSDFHDLFL